jgi:phage shock protein PspC (stress-responsive transcriptional regulator)
MSGRVQLCDEVMGRLMATLREGGDVSAEDRQHIATCPECNRVLVAAGQLEAELAADVPLGRAEEQLTRVTREAEGALRATRWRSAAFILLGVVAVMMPWLLVPELTEVMNPELKMRGFLQVLQVIGALVGLGAVGSLVVDGFNARPGGVKLYKRLGGQWFFGVFRGLAEAAGFPVWVLRVFFICLLCVGKPGWMIGVPLYLLLDASLQVHPEDRGMLYRFRLNRWLARISARSRRPTDHPHTGAVT